MTPPTGRGGPGRGQGRKPIDDNTVKAQVILPADMWAWCKAQGDGSSTLRTLIEQAMAEEPRVSRSMLINELTSLADALDQLKPVLEAAHLYAAAASLDDHIQQIQSLLK